MIIYKHGLWHIFSARLGKNRNMKQNEKKPVKKEKPGKGIILKEKVKRHLSDKDDVVTDEDLKNVIVGVKGVSSESEEPHLEVEDIPKKKIITPWDVVEDTE
jgi:hypothetical protein